MWEECWREPLSWTERKQTFGPLTQTSGRNQGASLLNRLQLHKRFNTTPENGDWKQWNRAEERTESRSTHGTLSAYAGWAPPPLLCLLYKRVNTVTPSLSHPPLCRRLVTPLETGTLRAKAVVLEPPKALPSTPYAN